MRLRVAWAWSTGSLGGRFRRKGAPRGVGPPVSEVRWVAPEDRDPSLVYLLFFVGGRWEALGPGVSPLELVDVDDAAPAGASDGVVRTAGASAPGYGSPFEGPV